jgi:Glyoxalase-like domain
VTAPARFKDLCLDANDHQVLADWWCASIGYVRRDDVEPPEEGWTRPADWPVPIVDPSGAGPLMWIVPVPEQKVFKNRVHFDVVGDTEALLAAGATMLRPRDLLPVAEEAGGIEWDVLADPEGNEFCVFSPES